MNTRADNELRPTTIEPIASAAAGHVMISQGQTRVICTASLSTDLPPWMLPRDGGPATRGWVTAEYAMMPGSTPQRKRRGGDSRGTEIQRLIARVLRAAVDLERMPGVLITCDCDVLVADGGTRTASITGAYVALAQALLTARHKGMIENDPIDTPVAAVSVGIVDGRPVLDLDYPLDVNAEVDMNVAMNGRGEYVEVQGTAEGAAFCRDRLNALLDLAEAGIGRLLEVQEGAIQNAKFKMQNAE